MQRFNLPDLGEGLQEAEIVRWHVAVGDRVAVDQPMVAMETAKAVVEVPAPFAGVIAALHGKPGDTVATGAPLVDFEGGTAVAASPATAKPAAATAATPGTGAPGTSQGGVVGQMPETDEVISAAPTGARSGRGRIRAVPAARELARRTNVDIETLTGSGPNGLITLDDVIGAGTSGSGRLSLAPRSAARWRRA